MSPHLIFVPHNLVCAIFSFVFQSERNFEFYAQKCFHHGFESKPLFLGITQQSLVYSFEKGDLSNDTPQLDPLFKQFFCEIDIFFLFNPKFIPFIEILKG